MYIYIHIYIYIYKHTLTHLHFTSISAWLVVRSVPWQSRRRIELSTSVWHESCIYVTCPIYMCVMTHSHIKHDSFMHVTCYLNHSYVWHDSFICVTWLIHMRDMTHSYVWHDSFIWDVFSQIFEFVSHKSSKVSFLYKSHTLPQKSVSMSHIISQKSNFSVHSLTSSNVSHIISIWINKSSVNPKSTSNQSSKACSVLQYPSRKVSFLCTSHPHAQKCLT